MKFAPRVTASWYTEGSKLWILNPRNRTGCPSRPTNRSPDVVTRGDVSAAVEAGTVPVPEPAPEDPLHEVSNRAAASSARHVKRPTLQGYTPKNGRSLAPAPRPGARAAGAERAGAPAPARAGAAGAALHAPPAPP